MHNKSNDNTRVFIFTIINTVLLVAILVILVKMYMSNKQTPVVDTSDMTVSADEPVSEPVYIDEEMPDTISSDDISRETVVDEVDENTPENLTLTTNGKSYTFGKPEKYNILTTSYKNLLKKTMNMTEDPDTSIIVLGDSNNITTAETTINCTTFDNIGSLYEQLYTDFDYSESKDDIQSTAYIYHKTGSYGDDAPLNYSCKKVDTFSNNDLTFTAYEVEYDTDYNDGSLSGNEAADAIVHTHCITVYGESEDTTDDPVEIILFSKNDENLVENYLSDLKEFCLAN